MDQDQVDVENDNKLAVIVSSLYCVRIAAFFTYIKPPCHCESAASEGQL
jgi:hypothetical protein